MYKILRRIDNNFNEKVRLPKIEAKEAREYYAKLWNSEEPSEESNEPEIIGMEDEEVSAPFTMEELKETLKGMKNGKAPGEDDLSAELYKNLGDKTRKRLLDFLNKMYDTETIPEEFRNSIVVSIFKKGDMKKMENYRGISLLNVCYKIYAKMMAKRIGTEAESFILECQNGFRSGRSCTDASYTIKLLMEKRIEYDLETHMCFIDFEKAYDMVNRKTLLSVLKKRGINQKTIRILRDIYKRTKIRIKIGNSLDPEYTEVSRGVRQGCPASCILFNIYMDGIIREWYKTNPQGIQLNEEKKIETILFADDQVIISKNENELQRSVYNLEKIAKKFGMKISSSKTKTLAFKGKEPTRSKIVVNGKIVEQTSSFRYLGTEISYRGEVDIEEKITKFLRVTGLINRIMNPNNIRKETRIRIYNTLAVPMLTYGSEVWALKKRDKQRISAAEMRFMRKTAKVTLRDRKRNTDILNTLEATPIIKKIKNYRKNWRRHVNRMPETRSPRMIQRYTPTGKRPRGRPRRKLTDTSGSSGSSGTSTPQTGQ